MIKRIVEWKKRPCTKKEKKRKEKKKKGYNSRTRSPVELQ